MPFGYSTFGASPFGAGVLAAPVAVPDPVPTVDSVIVTPTDAVIPEGGSCQFSAVALGTNGPPQDFTWTTTLGSTDANGLVSGITAAPEEQTGTVTATSILNPQKSGSVNFTVPAQAVVNQPPVVRSVSLQLGEMGGPAANLSNLMVSFHAASGPHASGQALYQSATETTDASGRLSFEIDGEAIGIGEAGLLAVLAPDGRHYLGLVAVA